MMLIDNKIYTCSTGHPILYSELPLYDEPYKYNDVLKNKYYIVRGNFEFFGNKIISKGKNNIIINKEFILNSTIDIFTNIKPNIIGISGLIFGFCNLNEKNDNYYLFIIKQNGFLSLQKRNAKNFTNLFPDNDFIHHNYNKENYYKMNIKYNSSSNEIITYINQAEIFKIVDESLENSEIGFISSDIGTIFTQFLLE